jgi:thioredoxin 1
MQLTKENHMTEHLNKDEFISKVFDYEKNKEWNYAGDLPAIVDFYAEWCGPCKMLSPVLEDLSKEFDGKLRVYKIDTDKEPEVSGVFGIQSVPTLLFIPSKGDPTMAMGALPKPELKKAIREVLGVE